MTEVSFSKSSLLQTFQALRSQFQLANTTAVLSTTTAGDQFNLTLTRDDGAPIQAIGPCEVKGAPVSVAFNVTEIEQAILEAHTGIESENVVLIIGDGIWVKDPAPATEEA